MNKRGHYKNIEGILFLYNHFEEKRLCGEIQAGSYTSSTSLFSILVEASHVV